MRNLFDSGDEGDFLADFVSVQLCAACGGGIGGSEGGDEK
jgi:hypothetical protein